MSQQDTIINGYKLIGKLGTSITGASFLAEEVKSGKKVVLKQLSREISTAKSYLERFIAHSRELASHPHPSIARLYGMFLHGGMYYITEQYCPGGNLGQKISKTGPFSPAQSLVIMKSLFEGLLFAANSGIHHGALHPSNIVFDSQGKALLSDFSVSTLAPSQYISNSSIASFLEPGANGEPWLQGDIYSLGALMVFMLSGKIPSQEMQTKGVARTLSLAGVPINIADALERATSAKPESRFSSLQSFARVLFQTGSHTELKSPAPEKVKFAKTFESPYAPVAERRITKAETKETAAGVAPAEFTKASIARRAGAFLIDHMMLLAVSALCYALGMRKDADLISQIIAALIYAWFILFFFLPKDGRKESRGVGKGVLGLRLINIRRGTLAGSPIAALRYLLGALPYIAVGIFNPYAIGGVLVIDMIFAFTGKGKRWQDLLIGTQLVNDEEIQVEDTFVVPVTPEAE